MPADALAGRLQQLLEEGSTVASAFSRAMRKRMEPLFWTGALEERKAGGGRRIVIVDRAAVMQWVGREYPSGLEGPSESMPARATAVATFRDSKAGAALDALPVFMRGFSGASLARRGEVLPLAELTSAFGLAGVLVESASPWTFSGTLALVENREVFLHIERVVPDLDAAVWTAGRLNQRVLEWLAPKADIEIIHAGDYDPVGLDEYLRVSAAAPDHCRLFVPDDFEERLIRYGSGDLLAKSASVLERVRAQANAEVRRVLDLMDRHGKALEQEALLIPMPE